MAFSLKDYEVIEEIGRGGFASIYRARQKSLSREVAIKRLSPQRTQNAADILRFRREAEAMASLTHDNIIAVFDYAFHNGSYYIVMEYIDGLAFDAALERCLPQACALFIMEKTAGALKTAHAQNIIHRDIKPANVLLGRNGQVKLADFGLALFRSGIESFTSPDSVLGTISYMAPEALVSPKEVDCRIDVFSMGCILYQVLAGKHPFDGSSFGEISYRILNENPPPLAADSVPASLAGLTMQCLQKDREKRPGMAEIHDELRTVTHDRYHEAQEKLIAFVRLGSTQKSFQDVPGAAINAASQKHVIKSRSSPIFAAAVLTAVIVALVLFSRPLFTGKKSPVSPLPAFPAFNASAGVETPQGMQPSERTQKNISKNGPAPVTGTTLDMKVGILVLRGLAAQDTVVLNNKPVTAIKYDKETRIELLPGYYRLEIRRKNGPPVMRELELVPFERQLIDLGKEQR